MIRIRDISLPPEHSVAQLSYEAAQLLRVANSKVRRVRIVRRSVDARKKPDIRIIYTIDVTVDGNEQKILKQRAVSGPPLPKQSTTNRPVLRSRLHSVRSWSVSVLRACLRR